MCYTIFSIVFEARDKIACWSESVFHKCYKIKSDDIEHIATEKNTCWTEKIDRESRLLNIFSDDIRTELVNLANTFHEQCLTSTLSIRRLNAIDYYVRSRRSPQNSHSHGSATIKWYMKNGQPFKLWSIIVHWIFRLGEWATRRDPAWTKQMDRRHKTCKRKN